MATTDWNVDGHYIAAETAEKARAEAARLYDFEPESVRPWSTEDQINLDLLHCTCDPEYRCDIHDTTAEQTYWGAQFGIRA